MSECAARWTVSNAPCAEQVFRWLADIPLCDHHYWRLLDAAVAVVRQEVQAEMAPREWEPNAAEVVYYGRRLSDGLIKIGTSARLRGRWSELRTEHGPMQLLLTHRGNRETETAMHSKFRSLRVEGEFFRPYKRLMTWIIEIRRLQPAHTLLRGTMPMADLVRLAEQPRRLVKPRSNSAIVPKTVPKPQRITFL